MIKNLIATSDFIKYCWLLLLSFLIEVQLIAQPIINDKPIAAAYINGSDNDLYGINNRFIENVGQYGDAYSEHPEMGIIKFGYEGFGIPVLFTSKGLIYLHRKISGPTLVEKEKEERSRNKKNKEEEIDELKVADCAITMEWVDANSNVEVIPESIAPEYHTYGFMPEKARAYKKITYKNLYNGVDLVYNFVATNKIGFEYSLMVKPGADVSIIKMRYGGDLRKIKIDADGNLILKSKSGQTIESIPVSYYGETVHSDKNSALQFKSKFQLHGREISFAFPENYDPSKSIVIDPFVTGTGNLTGTGVNAGIAKDVDFDYAGNVYVTGGGNGSTYKLAKFNAAGVLQWTFSGALTIPSWTFGTYYGGWVVEKTTGNIYCGQGFASGVGHRVVRINTTGIYDNYITTANPSFMENWKMYWQCNNGTPRLFIAGGGTNSNINFGIVTPPATAITSLNVTGIPYSSGGWAQDISDVIIDPATNDLYTIYGSLYGTPSLSNKIYKNPSPYSGANVAWNVLSGFVSIQEIANRPYLVGPEIDNSSNVFAINSSYLFYWDGKNLKTLNKATGAAVGTPLTIGANTKLMSGGIIADECNNIFVGAPNGTIKVYSFNGSVFDDAAKADITIPGFATSAVYDLAFDDSQKLLYASGNGFVGSFDVSSYNCTTSAFTLSVASSCGTLSATATISPAPPPGSTITYVLYIGNTQIATNTTGIFNGLSPNITYTIKATVNQACSGSVTNTTFTLPGPSVSPAVTNTNCGTSTGSITVSAAGGTAPYTYSINGVNFQPGNSFTNLAAGIYTVTVKDVNNCSNTMLVTILNSNGPTATFTKTDATCGSNTGTITAIGTGGVAPLTYSINGTTFQTGNFFTGINAGTYTLTVKDANGCTNAVSVTIISANAPSVSGIPASTFCNTSNGSITAVGTGGTAPLQYSINGNNYQSAALFSNLANGTYTLYVKDALGCITSVSVIVPTTALPTLSATSTVASCGNANGSITATGAGGVAPLQYSINGINFQTSNYFGGLTAGTYIVTVKDANNCINTFSVAVTSNNSPVVTATTNPSSCISNTGTITAAGSGGTGALTYSINGVTYQASTLFSGLAAGVYMLQVKDANGCIGAVYVNVLTATPPAVVLTVTPTACSSSNGIITAVGSGGTAPYQYKINSGAYQPGGTFNSLATGIYVITIKDANGCSSTAQATMVNVAGLSITATNVSSSCVSSSGIITANAIGGVAPLQYSINGVIYQSNNVFTLLPGGNYTVYVKDANGCISTTTQTVLTLAEPTIAVTSTNATCAGSNATITITGSGGTPPLQYSIDGVTYLNSNIFINVAPGVYTVSVKDLSGCTKSALVTITTTGTGPGITSFTLVSKGPFYCDNETFGKLTNPKVNGATCGSCTYSLDGAAFIPNATQLYTAVTVGTHYVTAKDVNGCTKTIIVTMVPGVPATATATVTGTACGASTGSIALVGIGVNTPFHSTITGTGGPWLTWDPSHTYSGLAPGVYTIILEDDASFGGGNPWHCYDTIMVVVPSIGGPTLTTSKTNGSCHQNDGSITASSTGGTLPVEYSLDGGAFQPSGVFTNLGSGIYTVDVMDAAGCINTKIDTIINPDGPTVTAVTNSTSCGINNGTITASGIGGNAPLQYSINGTVFQSSNVFNGLAAGTYTVTVLDALLCFNTSTAIVSTGTFPKVTAFTIAASCNSSNGVVVANGINGTTPYQYSIDGVTFQSSNTFTGLPAAVYDITIEDANGCLNTTTVSVGNIAAPALTLASAQATCGNSNGTITVTGTGGIPPLQYSVDGVTFQSSNIFTGLPAGPYSVIIKDANGCQNSKNILITSPNVPQTISATLTSSSCGNSNGTIVAAATGGIAPLTYSINNSTYQASTTFSGLTAGSYPLTVKDANGCIKALPVTLINLAGPGATAVATLSSCFANDGTITATGTGGTGLITYSKNGVTFQSSPVFTALAPATYTITAKDAKGCTATTNATISQVTGPNISAYDSSSVCGGNIVAAGSIGQPSYQYNINNAAYQSSNIFPCLISGTYTVRVKDANGCLDSIIINVVSPLPVELLSFTGHAENAFNKLEWITASETKSDYFTIEKSKDGYQFKELATVNAAGQSHHIIHYTVNDNSPNKIISYYRLKQTDLDGKFVYSQTISIRSKSTTMFNWSYNAAANQLTISCLDCDKEQTRIVLIDATGRQVFNSSFSDVDFTIVTGAFARGMYSMQLKNANNIENFKVVIY